MENLYISENDPKQTPKALRNKVWNDYIGIQCGVSKCFVCQDVEISQQNFECGHVLAKSCWTQNKLGVTCVAKNKKNEWNERIKNLEQQIQYWVDNPSEKIVEIIELFY